MKRILTLTLLCFLSLEAKPLFSNNQQKENTIYIGALKDLVIATQKTRGLTNSYMNGNTAALLLVYDNRKEMKKAIGTMESISLATDPVINTRATTISQALIKLNNKAFRVEPSQTFSNYTEQIAHILMLAQSVNKRAAEDMSLFAKENATIMMEVMLPMTEYVGQLRGFGAGLAAKNTINKQELEKVMILLHEIATLNKQLHTEMELLISQHAKSYPDSINEELNKIDEKFNDYSSFIQNNFSEGEIDVDPNSYFDTGTKLISLIINVYDKNNKAILDNSKGWL